MATELDLTSAGTSGTIGGAAFTTSQSNSGTGIFDAYLQVQHTGSEQGYNSDAAAQYDAGSSHVHNHSLLLAAIPIVIGDGTNGTAEGVAYREFLLDANEANGGTNRLISLDKLQIWQEESGSLTNFTADSGFAGSHTNYLAYNLDAGSDNWVGINSALSSGSGRSDIRVLIPDSYFINDAAHRYVTLYSALGLQGGAWSSGAGFEEWGQTKASSGPVSALSLRKTASVPGDTADTVGEVITYAISVDNVGNTTLTGLTVTDPSVNNLAQVLSGGFNVGDANHNGVFDAGESWRYSASHTVTQADIDTNGAGRGAIVNTVTADTDQTAPSTASTSITVEQHASLTLVKTPDVSSVNAAGQVITYTVAVANTGSQTLTSPAVTDPQVVTQLGPVLDFNAPVPGAPLLAQVLVGDYNAGDTNHNGVQDSGETFVFVNGGDSNQNGVIDPGETFLFTNIGDTNQNGAQDTGETFQYYNAGDTNHNGVKDGTESFQFVVSHDLAPVDANSDGANDGDTNHNGAIDPGETWLYTATHTVTQAEIDNGGVVDPTLALHNTAFVATGEGLDASGSASVHVAQNPHIAVSKTASIPDADGDGKIDGPADDITYTIRVVNDGNMTLTGVAVGDSLLMLGTATETGGTGTNGDGILDVGETWTYTAAYDVHQSDIDNRGNVDGSADDTIHNTVTVTTHQGASDPDANGSASANVDIDYRPHLSVAKTAVLPAADSDGKIDSPADDITYAITVVNDGNVSLTGVTATDSLVSLGSHTDTGAGNHGDGILDVGETWTYAAAYDVHQSDIDNHGSVDGTADNAIRNTVTIGTAQGASGTASAGVDIAYNPHIDLTKTAALPAEDSDGKIDSATDDITYTVTLLNDGNVTLTGVSTSDSLVTLGTATETGGSGTNGDGILDVGETWTYTATYDVRQSQVDAGGSITNTASVTTSQGASDSATASVTIVPAVVPNASITLIKTALGYHDLDHNGLDAGDVIDYSLVVKNTGNVTLHEISVSDSASAEVTVFGSTISALAAGDTDSSYTATYVLNATDISRGYFDNEAVAASDETSAPSGTVHTILTDLMPLM